MTVAKPDTYHRAFREVMNYIIPYCTTRSYMDENGKITNYPSSTGFLSEGYRDDGPDRKARYGDIVILQSAPTTEWYISWYKEEKRHYYKDEFGNDEPDRYEREHLLQSLETGKLCNWSNVSLSYFNREELEKFPSWKWSDKQFEFKDKWWNVCYKEKDAYMVLPVYPEFGEGFEVTLGTRRRYGGIGSGDHTPTKTFPDWRKLTKKQLGDFYDECVAAEPKKGNDA